MGNKLNFKKDVGALPAHATCRAPLSLTRSWWGRGDKCEMSLRAFGPYFAILFGVGRFVACRGRRSRVLSRSLARTSYI